MDNRHTRDNLGAGENIYTRFSRFLDSQPDVGAIADSRRFLTYRQLDTLAETVRRMFPVERPRFVGVVMDHSAEMIAALLGVIKSGGAYVAAEPSFPVERTAFMMKEAEVDFIIVSPAYADRFPGYRTVVVGSGLKADETCSGAAAEPVSADAPAYVLYTSGTTGHPKGVVVSNGNVVHYASAFHKEFRNGPGDVMAQLSVCTFDIFVEEVFATLLNGAMLDIVAEEVRDDAPALMDYARRRGLTIISAFPYLLLELNKLDRISPSLRLLISGGDVLRASYVDRLVDRVAVSNTYGPSETTVCATYFRCDGASPLPDGTYPIGKAVEGTEVVVLDGNMRESCVGELGEIGIMGEGVSKGYLTRVPESDNFSRMPDGRPVYRSGDLGYRLPDGNLAFLHRKDTQVMIGGKRVECEEVENVLCKMEGIETGAVFPVSDRVGLPHLAAVIVPKSGIRVSLQRLRAALGRYLTAFMMPEYIKEVDSIPLTANGKIDRDALPSMLDDESSR